MKAKTKLWFTEGGKTVMGAGRAELLKTIEEERSLRKACKKLGISYKHAWTILANPLSSQYVGERSRVPS